MLKDPTVIGKIGQPFGVRGWVRVNSFCSPADNILDYTACWLKRPGASFARTKQANDIEQVDIKEIKPHGKGFVAMLAGVTDRDQALALRGAEIVIERDALPELPADDYYWYQLQGLTVKSVTGEELGTLTQMLETGANDVMVVEPSANSFDKKKRLIPYLFESVVKSVDLSTQTLTVEWDLDF